MQMNSFEPKPQSFPQPNRAVLWSKANHTVTITMSTICLLLLPWWHQYDDDWHSSPDCHPFLSSSDGNKSKVKSLIPTQTCDVTVDPYSEIIVKNEERNKSKTIPFHHLFIEFVLKKTPFEGGGVGLGTLPQRLKKQCDMERCFSDILTLIFC